MLLVTVTHNRLGTVQVELNNHDTLDRDAAFAARAIAYPGAPVRVSDGRMTWTISRSRVTHTEDINE